MIKLLVIVLSLISERHLIHKISFRRFYWFNDYCQHILRVLPANAQGMLKNPWIMLFLFVAPITLVTFLLLVLVSHLHVGMVYLILNLIIFYYCLGPDNVFYPAINDHKDPKHNRKDNGDGNAARRYLTEANSQVFAPIFWYVLLGSLAVVVYRVISLCQQRAEVSAQASVIIECFNWIPVRITALFYLFVGNFQRGYSYFIHHVLLAPNDNDELLANTGMLVLQEDEAHDGEVLSDGVHFVKAQRLVEYALLLNIVLLALLIFVSWF